MKSILGFNYSRLFLIAGLVSLLISNNSSAQTTLLHYWSFNKITARVNIPAPPIKADYSYLDTNIAVVQYDTVPGTPQHYVDSINTNSKSNGAYDNVAGDTVNARLGYAASNALRIRNPSWSSELRIYMPSTLYSNIFVTYALQSSSTTSGQHTQVFAYSTDSGATWKGRSGGMTVNGVNVDTLDVTQSQYQQTGYGRVIIGFGSDTTVNNNPKLVLRIRWSGQSSSFSGNNRIDNLTVEGGPVPKTITLSQPNSLDTLVSGQRDTILYTTTGKITRKKSFFYSLDSGMTWTLINSDTGFVRGAAFGFVWMAPVVYNPVHNAMIAVVDSAAVEGFSSPFEILPVRLLPPDANLIHYWHFNALAGPYLYSSIPAMPADYSSVDHGKTGISYVLQSGTSLSYLGYVEGAPGTGVNDKMAYPSGESLQIGNPSDSMALLFFIPTTNHINISVNYALQASNGVTGPLVQIFDYSLDSGRTWKTTALKKTVDSINGASFINGGWGYVSVDLSSDSLTSDNPNLVFRLRFAGNNSGSNGYVRIDNVSVVGPVGQISIAGAPVLVHYWNFNTLTIAYHVPNVPNLKADYSLIDTNSAFLEYYLDPGTSSSYLGYIDNVASADTSNLRNGAVAGQALRVRNPVDSIELRWHIPSTGYHNLVVKFVVESSSTTSGDSTQIYSYSVDGGATWKNTGMTVNGANADTLDVTHQAQYQGSSWGLVTVTFGNDAAVNNNPNLIFRIIYSGNTHLTSGNNRFDDFTLDGVPGSGAPAISPLIHYWHFDSLNTAYHNPGVPPLLADYSAISPNSAEIQYVLEPGTSSDYAGYIDNVAGDSLNAQLGAIAGNALRVRNPSDSMELRFVVPTTGYKDITVSYALESSSTTSGQLTELFDYSVDGGTSWKSSSVTVQGANVDTLDVTPAIFQGTSWGLVTIGFGNDTSVNNNPNLVLRIKFSGNTSKTSGNNRFDNVTVEGTSLFQPEGPGVISAVRILDDTSKNIDTLFAYTHHTIAYSVSGAVSPQRMIEYSTDGGITWAVLANNEESQTYDWTVPATASYNALVRVVDQNGVSAVSRKFVILVIGKVTSVQVSESYPITNQSVNIIWNTTDYVGESVNIDISHDSKQTWTPIVSGYAFGSIPAYAWTTPSTPDTGLVIRVTFAYGVVGFSAPFRVYAAPSLVENGEPSNDIVSIWPNPFSDISTISYNVENAENVTLAILDLTGRQVANTTIGTEPAGPHEFTFDGSMLPAGSYFYILNAGAQSHRGRFVIYR